MASTDPAVYRRAMDADIDLPAYFTRIGYTGPSEPSFAVLRELNARHVAHIAFETLDPFLGRPVDLDPAALPAKLVRSRRGGYCQEHNALFYDVLNAVGFSVSALGGRVVWAFKGQPAPLTHRLTLVELPEGNFIADVGFGGQSPTVPLRLEPDLEQITPHGTYRVAREGEVFGLQLRLDDRWETMYQFTLAAQTRVDFEVAHRFTWTHPRPLLTQNLGVSRSVPDARANLRDSTHSHRHADGQAYQPPLGHR